MANGISRRYQSEQFISVLRDVGWYLSYFLQTLIEHTSGKYLRPCSDAAFGGIWSGFRLCVDAPQKER